MAFDEKAFELSLRNAWRRLDSGGKLIVRGLLAFVALCIVLAAINWWAS